MFDVVVIQLVTRIFETIRNFVSNTEAKVISAFSRTPMRKILKCVSYPLKCRCLCVASSHHGLKPSYTQRADYDILKVKYLQVNLNFFLNI